jgi:zinc transport system substrate-binding protein
MSNAFTFIALHLSREWLLVGFLCLSSIALADKNTVQKKSKPLLIASIKPLTLIAQEVAGDFVDVQTLLPITASPHDYPLKMSDYRRLETADLIVWIGPELESFLARPFATFSAEKILTLYDLSEMHWPDAAIELEKNSHEHHHHEHTSKDPHLWLDPHNAVIIANQVATKLALLKPESADYFQKNAATFAASIKQLDQKIAQQLVSVKDVGFVVYHEGYAHFVRRYNLHQLAYIAYIPGINLGAKHLLQLRKQLEKEKGKCVFGEPSIPTKNLEAMAKELSLKPGLLDPMGNQQVSSYNALIEALSSAFLDCLADGPNHRGAH